MIEKDFNIPFIADLALREKQIQQNYRPIIAVHKWFARRPGTLFRGLLLSEFGELPVKDAFYKQNDFKGVHIADPFMGGGIPLLEANRIGCDVTGYDINPMAYWIVKQEIEHLDLNAYSKAAYSLRNSLEKEIGHLFRTKCLVCGSIDAHVKYFLWVKVRNCVKCNKEIDLFPGYLISQNRRHPKNVIICPSCHNLNEKEDRARPGDCDMCGKPLAIAGPAKRNRCKCPSCGEINSYPNVKAGPPEHRLFAIEYHCPSCKPGHKGRFFKVPDSKDLSLQKEANTRWRKMRPRFVPDDFIPAGDETNRLHRWGYKRYREMLNIRQLMGLELSCRIIEKESNERIRNALATNLSDLLRYQNMLCRYDKMALKSLDIFSIHGFPVGLIQCESNLLGIRASKRETCVGSGGWLNIINKFLKAKAYCDNPFEVKHLGKKKVRVQVPGEWIGDTRNGSKKSPHRDIKLFCSNAATKKLSQESLDAVFTDPPYFGNVQYAELMDFCYVWLRRLVGKNISAFSPPSTRNIDELTKNESMGRDIEDFTEGLSSVFGQMAKALKPGSPLAFTYHHNDLNAYFPVAVAILDSGLTCSASLPCPAEMGGSIHINGTGSSIIDTIFVCRSTGSVPRKWVPKTPEGAAALVEEDIQKLRLGNVRPTYGDLRCILFGHMIRLAIWTLRTNWNKEEATKDRLKSIADWIHAFGGVPAIEKHLSHVISEMPTTQTMMVQEPETDYGTSEDEIPF